jgi:hypothetical protein
VEEGGKDCLEACGTRSSVARIDMLFLPVAMLFVEGPQHVRVIWISERCRNVYRGCDIFNRIQGIIGMQSKGSWLDILE